MGFQFMPNKPITLVIDCSHNQPGGFNPFHWSSTMWALFHELVENKYRVRDECRGRG